MKIKELQSDLLYRDIESRIDSIKSRKNIYITIYRITKLVVFISGALITILTGWKMHHQCEFQIENSILIISAGITLLAAIDGFFAFRDKGKSYDYILFDLRRLRDRICFDYMKDPNIYNQNKHNHFEDYQKILESQKAIIENSDIEEE